MRAATVDSMALPTGMSQQAVGHHLALLRAANFIESQRDGKELLHSLTDVVREFWGFAEKVLS